MVVNIKKFGYDVCCFIGINLNVVCDYYLVFVKLNVLDEVVEVYYIIGVYNIFVKLMCCLIEEL